MDSPNKLQKNKSTKSIKVLCHLVVQSIWTGQPNDKVQKCKTEKYKNAKNVKGTKMQNKKNTETTKIKKPHGSELSVQKKQNRVEMQRTKNAKKSKTAEKI